MFEKEITSPKLIPDTDASREIRTYPDRSQAMQISHLSAYHCSHARACSRCSVAWTGATRLLYAVRCCRRG